MANLDVSSWERIIDFEKELSATATRALLKFRFSSREHAHMSALLEKARAGRLTAKEEKEMDTYELLASVLGVLHSKARQALKRRATGPEQHSPMRFEADHIIPQQHHGPMALANLAWACFACNRRKLSNLAGIDPKTHRRVWLFNPRRQKWQRHFRWEGAVLVGRTPVGRATIDVLGISVPHLVALRTALIEEGQFPPAT